jgi:dihydroorotate dehydrogenase (NAD+) catalytic subunit
MSIDLKTRTPWLSNVTGGLSGPAIKPIALQMVYKTSRAVSVPIIGIGGIASTGDALEFLLAGASAIQIGTANFFDPAVTMKVIEGLQKYCEAHGLKSLADLKILE